MLIEVNDNTFDKEVIEESNNRVIIVDYYSNSCGPCKRLIPKLENVSEKTGNNIVKVNIEDSFESSMRNKIRTIPTLVVYKDGEVVQSLTGCSQISEYEIEELFNL